MVTVRKDDWIVMGVGRKEMVLMVIKKVVFMKGDWMVIMMGIR